MNESSSCPVFLDESSFREAKLVLLARDLIRLIGNAGTGGIFSRENSLICFFLSKFH